MKKQSVFALGMTFAGSFLGAGYVSGQELWQYFGSFGAFGMIGLTVTMLLFLFLGYALYSIVSKTGICEMDKVIVLNNNRLLLMLVSVLQILNFISIYIIMTAGIAAMFETVFGFSKYIVSAVTSAVTVILAVGGIGRLVKVFSVTVPILTLCAVIISIIAIFERGEFISFSFQSEKSVLWLFSCLVYMSFNFFGIIGIMSPVYAKTKSGDTAKKGILFGTFTLFVIAAFLIVSLNINSRYITAQLPMLDLSFSMGRLIGIVYAVLLFLAMLGTALSSLVASDNFLLQRLKMYKCNRILFLVLIAGVCYFGSLVGFSDLIGILYPIFGIAGFFAIVLIAVNYFKLKRN